MTSSGKTQLPFGDPTQDDVLAPFRELYNRIGGSTYALTIDGDVLVMNVPARPVRITPMSRQPLWSNMDVNCVRRKRGTNGWKLASSSPAQQVKPWLVKPWNRISSGLAEFGRRSFSWAWFMNRAASAGVQYFDEEMNPQINSPEAVARASEHG